MFRSTTTFRIFEEKVKESQKLTAGWTNTFCQDRLLNPQLPAGWKAGALKNEELLLDLAKCQVKNLQSFWSRALRLIMESLFLMFSKMERRTRFQRSPSSRRGSNYIFHLPDVLQRFRRAQAPDVGHSFLRPFGLVVLQLTIEKQRDPDEGAQV